MIKRNKLKELVRTIVKEAMDAISDPAAMGTAMAVTDVASMKSPASQAVEQAKMERDQRRMTQKKLQATQKAEKLDRDKHKAEEKQFKIKTVGYKKAETDLKKSL